MVHLVPRPIHYIHRGIQTRMLMPRNPTLLHRPLDKRDTLMKSQSMIQMMTTATLVKRIFLSFL
jgi:hypothetical protein